MLVRLTTFIGLFVSLPIFAQSAAGDQGFVVINIHALDCPPCLRWENVYKTEWLRSPEYKLVRYVQIESPSISESYLPKHWPQDLLPVLAQTGGRGVPRYLIEKDGRIISDRYGVDNWPNTVSDLKKFLAGASGSVSAPVPGTPGSFDGKWAVVHTCAPIGQAKGYTIRYEMTVVKGAAHAQWGSEGKPDSFALTGNVQPDGKAAFSVAGYTGDSRYTAGGVSAGAPYAYAIEGQFSSTQGHGDRTKERHCTFEFTRK